MVVPGQGCDGVACAHADLTERAGEPARARGALGIGISEQRSMRLARDDLHASELRGRMLDDIRNQQRPVHHEGGLEHGVESPNCLSVLANLGAVTNEVFWLPRGRSTRFDRCATPYINLRLRHSCGQVPPWNRGLILARS